FAISRPLISSVHPRSASRRPGPPVRCSAPGYALVFAPVNRAESGVAEEVVGKGDGLHRLMPVGHAGRARIAGRPEPLNADGVRTMHAHGHPDVAARDDLLSGLVDTARPG